MTERIALRTVLRHVSRAPGVVIEAIAVRRPEVLVRRTRYCGVVVDETMLTRVFPWVATPSRLQSLVVLEGTIAFGGLPTLSAGDAALLQPGHQALARFVETTFLDIEWTTPEAAKVTEPSRLASLPREDVAALAAAVADEATPQRALFERAFALHRRAGAPLDDRLDASRLAGAPSDRDHRIAAAISRQLETLATAGDSFTLGENADLSPRQLQRIVAEWGTTYGVGIKSWRDLRNRWRVQLGAVLLGRPELSVADVAAEVGYGSAAALARAFANVDLPAPGEVRRRMLALRGE